MDSPTIAAAADGLRCARLIVTIAVERWALAVGRWRYAATMATIAGIGLSPLLQWIAIPLLILAAAHLILPPLRSHR